MVFYYEQTFRYVEHMRNVHKKPLRYCWKCAKGVHVDEYAEHMTTHGATLIDNNKVQCVRCERTMSMAGYNL